MTQLAAFLIAISGSVAARVLVALGIGWITFEGFSAFAAQVVSAVQSSMAGILPDVLAVLGLAGFPTAVGVVLGAYVARASLSALSFLGRRAT